MEWYRLHEADPPPWEQPQRFPDEAPYPIWLVPPAHRAARVADILAAVECATGARPSVQLQDAEPLLELLPGWLSRLGVRWDPQEGLRWWSCPSGPLVVWRRAVSKQP